jgi:hypothetical protein
MPKTAAGGGGNLKKAKPTQSKRHKKQVICPYCGAQALLREGSFLFENPYINHLYVCVRYPACDAYVAAHENTKKPMGSLANGALRKKRLLAHQYFDQLWKGVSPVFTRKQAYNWLSDKLGGHLRRMHIGRMGEGMCDLVILESKRVMRIRREQQAASEGG